MLSLRSREDECRRQAPFPLPDPRFRLAKAFLVEGVVPSMCHDDNPTKEIFRDPRLRMLSPTPTGTFKMYS